MTKGFYSASTFCVCHPALRELPRGTRIGSRSACSLSFFALQFHHGYLAAAFTLDGIAGQYDSPRNRKCGSRLLSQIARPEGVLAPCPIRARPGRRSFLQNCLPRLPVHFPLFGTPPPALWL